MTPEGDHVLIIIDPTFILLHKNHQTFRLKHPLVLNRLFQNVDLHTLKTVDPCQTLKVQFQVQF